MKAAVVLCGLPCKTCGSTDYYVSTKRCRACTIAAAAAWQKRNRIRTNQKNNRWRKANPKPRKTKQKPRGYAQRKAANPESFSAATARQAAIRRARIRNATVDSACPRIAALYEIAAWLRSRGDEVHVDHIVPLARGGTHGYDNLRIISADENRKKGARLL